MCRPTERGAETLMNIGSLFSGIGGFDLGFHQAGFDVRWQVEIEPFCRSVLETRFPKAQRFEDVKEVGAHNLGRVDVICAGVPCQDVSVAGKRAGLAGERTGGSGDVSALVYHQEWRRNRIRAGCEGNEGGAVL